MKYECEKFLEGVYSLIKGNRKMSDHDVIHACNILSMQCLGQENNGFPGDLIAPIRLSGEKLHIVDSHGVVVKDVRKELLAALHAFGKRHELKLE